MAIQGIFQLKIIIQNSSNDIDILRKNPFNPQFAQLFFLNANGEQGDSDLVGCSNLSFQNYKLEISYILFFVVVV